MGPQSTEASPTKPYRIESVDFPGQGGELSPGGIPNATVNEKFGIAQCWCGQFESRVAILGTLNGQPVGNTDNFVNIRDLEHAPNMGMKPRAVPLPSCDVMCDGDV